MLATIVDDRPVAGEGTQFGIDSSGAQAAVEGCHSDMNVEERLRSKEVSLANRAFSLFAKPGRLSIKRCRLQVVQRFLRFGLKRTQARKAVQISDCIQASAMQHFGNMALQNCSLIEVARRSAAHTDTIDENVDRYSDGLDTP